MARRSKPRGTSRRRRTGATAQAGSIVVINMIPKALSGEAEQDSEPSLAVDPADPRRIVATAFTPDPFPVTPCDPGTIILTGRGFQDTGINGCSRTPVVMDDSEFFATKLVLGRTDHERVDVETHVAALGITKTIRDVIVDRSDGTVYGLCERPLAQIAYGNGLVVATVKGKGGEVLGRWEFDSAR